MWILDAFHGEGRRLSSSGPSVEVVDDDPAMAPDPLAAELSRWAAELRAQDATRSRTRERWLRQQAEEGATWTGTLLDLAERRQAALVVYSGPLDAYFGHALGRLPYRSIRFEHQHLPGVPRVQAVATVNYPGPEPYTRITEFKHLTGQRHSGTSIVREYPTDAGDPYYPVPGPESDHLAHRYRELAARESGVVFLGRLAQYRYLNMDQAVAAALVASARLVRDLG